MIILKEEPQWPLNPIIHLRPMVLTAEWFIWHALCLAVEGGAEEMTGVECLSRYNDHCLNDGGDHTDCDYCKTDSEYCEVCRHEMAITGASEVMHAALEAWRKQ